MTKRFALLLAGTLLGLIAAGEAAAHRDTAPPTMSSKMPSEMLPKMPGVFDADLAHSDYKLKCQGCHRPDGSGDDHSNPPMRGVVARFLSVPGGRDFLGRVPGVATTNLDNVRLANLVNWTLYTFDPQHLPRDFRPFTAAELGRLRQNPLRLERAETRARLVEGFSQAGNDRNLAIQGSLRQ